MKRKFFIHIIVIVVMALTLVLSVFYHLWFCSIFTVSVLILSVITLYKMFSDTLDLLKSEQNFRRKVENSQRTTESQMLYYKTLMENVDTAVMVITDSGHTEWANSFAQKFIGESCMLTDSIMGAISENKEIIQFENREYVISHSNINTDTGKRIIVAMKDIQNAMDKTEFDSWHKLVRVLTHEIMNSITPIISLSDTLCDMASTNIMDESDTIKEGLGVIHRRSQGLLTFVENYRKLTRVTLPIKSKIMVSELFADIQKLYTQPYISFQIENADTDSIYADRGQMEQVIINLLNNAIDAVPTSNARIICSFRTESSGSSYHSIISITNNGKVILPEVLERVFVPFFSTKKNGSGIGLSLCKQIIMNHGGDITICSDNDTGTTVEIKL